MNTSVLLIDEPQEGIRRLTMNRPEKHNALNDDLRLAIFEKLRDADSDKDVSVIVIRGAGESFCSGYDLSSVNNPVERTSFYYKHLTLPTILIV